MSKETRSPATPATVAMPVLAAEPPAVERPAAPPEPESAAPGADDPDAATPQELSDGQILDDGNPFASHRQAKERMSAMRLPADKWEVQSYGGGFTIVRKVGVEQARATGDAEAYKWVKFHPKSDPMAPDDVVLAVNGEVLQIRRNERIPIAARFLEAADHATYKHYTQQPGQNRKVDAVIRKYPYDVLGDATRDDFVRWKRAGTRAVLANAERMGIAVEA